MKPALKQRVTRYQKVLEKTHIVPGLLGILIFVGFSGFFLNTPTTALARSILPPMFWIALAIPLAITNTNMQSEMRTLAKPLRPRGLSKQKKIQRANPEVDFK
jgi:hypothetical protein